MVFAKTLNLVLNYFLLIFGGIVDNSVNRLLHHLLDKLQDETGTDQFLLDSILSCYGLEILAYVTTDPSSLETRSPICKVTYSTEWQDYYKQTSAEHHDPAVIYGLREIIPFEWRNVELFNPKQLEYLNIASEFGLGANGFSIPIRDRSGARALVSMTIRHNDHKWEKYSRRYRSELVNIAYLLHERFSSNIEPEDHDQYLGENLTSREIEALQWTALGKTSEETAIILGLSKRAVNFHVNNAKLKLDTVTRSHAVARASALGLILPVL